MSLPTWEPDPRLAYEAARRAARDKLDTREERGLPKHPANGWIDCAECGGAGEHLHNDSPIGDPQCEYMTICGECDGEGVVIDGHIDPMLLLRRARFNRRHRLGLYEWGYSRARRAALGKSLGYALLDAKVERIHSERRLDAAEARMIADADLCASESGRALAAWINSTRRVA